MASKKPTLRGKHKPVVGADVAGIDGVDLTTEFEQIRRLAEHFSNLSDQLDKAGAASLSRIYRVVKAVEGNRDALERAALIAGITLNKRAEKNLYYTFIKAMFPVNKAAETLSDYAAALKRAADWRLTYEELRGYLEAHGPYSLMMGRHRPASKVAAAPAGGGQRAANPPKHPVRQPTSPATKSEPATPSPQPGTSPPASPAHPQPAPASPATGTAGADNASANAAPSAKVSPLVMATPLRASSAAAPNQPGLGIGRLYDTAKYGGHDATASLAVMVDRRGHFWVQEVTSFTPLSANVPPSSGGNQNDSGDEALSDLLDNILHFRPCSDAVAAVAPTTEDMALWDFDGVTTEQEIFRFFVNTMLNNAQVTERLQGADGEFTVRRTRPTSVRISVANGDFRVAITIGVNISPEQHIDFNGWVKPGSDYNAALTCLEVGCGSLHQAIKELAGPEGNPGTPLRWQGNLDGLLLSNGAGQSRWLPNERRRIEDGSVPVCPVITSPAVAAEGFQSGAGQ